MPSTTTSSIASTWSSALVTGPGGSHTVVRCTDGPPAEDSEQALLIQWVMDVIRAVQAAAAGPEAPVHLYCYNRYDQKVLLEALKRHLEQVAALPAFFDLMTQSAALSQPIISFLAGRNPGADEPGHRLRPPARCRPHPEVRLAR